MRLSWQDQDTILAFAQRCHEGLGNIKNEEAGYTGGLKLHTSDKPVEFLETLALCDWAKATWTYHPKYSALDSRHFWWAKLSPAENPDEIVAVTSHRLFETDDFVDDFRLWMMFADGPPRIDIRPPQIAGRDKLPALDGKVAMGGATSVNPEWRRLGIYKLFSPMCQSLSFVKFKFDWYTALFRETELHQNLGKQGARFNRIVPFLSGEYAPLGYDVEVRLAYKSADEFLRDVSEEMTTGER